MLQNKVHITTYIHVVYVPETLNNLLNPVCDETYWVVTKFATHSFSVLVITHYLERKNIVHT